MEFDAQMALARSQSAKRITHVQWYAGGVMRSLHRYASDALVLVAMVHLVREYLLGRMCGARWLAWVTGVPLLWLLFAAGMSGYCARQSLVRGVQRD